MEGLKKENPKPCSNLDFNTESCGCTFPSCDKKGMCCKCIRFHRERGELPGCLFPPDVEKTFERSLEQFVAAHR